ncbi:CHASE domain-containing sensor histidine kinase [Roseospira navarrensis]|nr:ATP-binding protein [Roseospira navarrensis]
MGVGRALKQWAPGLALILAGLGGAAVVGLGVEEAEQARASADFRSAVALGAEAVRDDATAALDRLVAAQAFWTARPDSTASDFHQFVRGFPGIDPGGPLRAVALAPRVDRRDATGFLAHMAHETQTLRAIGYPPFRIWPDSDTALGFPAIYVEPPEARQGVLGYDMFTNPARRAAMRRAAGEGRVIASAPVLLTQDRPEPRSSVLLVAPLYAQAMPGAGAPRPWWYAASWGEPGGDSGGMAAGRSGRGRHVGFVAMGYSPSIGLAEKVQDRIANADLSVAIWDGGSVTNVLRGTMPRRPPPLGDPALFHVSGPVFRDGVAQAPLEAVERFDFAGRVWWVGFHGQAAFRPLLSRLVPWGMAAAILFGAVALAVLSQRLVAQRVLLEQGVAERTRELVRANTALRDSQARAEAANAAKTQFLSSMSHELRTPLNAIIGFAQMLSGGIGMGPDPDSRNAKVRQYADYILSAGQSLLAQVGRVLDLSRIEAGRLSLKPERIDIAPVVKDSVAIMRPVAAAQSIRLAVDVAPGVSPCFADPQAVRQILDNLLSNAIKFSGADSVVTARLRTSHDGPQGMVCLEVQDHGAGIPPDQIEKVLEPFHQVADQLTRGHPGLGLGLAIVKELVDGHGGRLTLDSTVGRGTTVRVFLPQAVPVPGPLSVEDDGGPEAGRRGETDPLRRLIDGHADFAAHD